MIQNKQHYHIVWLSCSHLYIHMYCHMYTWHKSGLATQKLVFFFCYKHIDYKKYSDLYYLSFRKQKRREIKIVILNNPQSAHYSLRLTFAPVSVFCFNLDRCDKMAVQSLLPHTTASPVCMWLGSVSVLNFTEMTFVSACLAVRPLPVGFVVVPNKVDVTL